MRRLRRVAPAACFALGPALIVPVPALAPPVAAARSASLAPSLSRIVIADDGASRFEGRGKPGSKVVVRRDGQPVGTALVGASGRWALGMGLGERGSDHRFTTAAAKGGRLVPGDEVRIAIPREMAGDTVISYEQLNTVPQAPSGSAGSDVRRRAEQLAIAASELFSEITGSKPAIEVAQVTRNEPKTREKADATEPRGVAAIIGDWLERASEAYQREIIGPLSIAPPGSAGVVERKEERQKSGAPPQPAESGPVESTAEQLVAGANRAWLALEEWFGEAGSIFKPDGSGEPPVETVRGVDGTSDRPKSAPQEVAEATKEAAEPKSAAKAEIERQMKENERRFLEKLKMLEDAQKKAEEEKKAAPSKSEDAKRTDRAEADARRDAQAIAKKAAERKAEIARLRAENEKRIAEGLKKLEALQQAEQERKAREEKVETQRRASEAKKREAERKAQASEERRMAALRYTEEMKAADLRRQSTLRAEEAARAEKARKADAVRAAAVASYAEARLRAEAKRTEAKREVAAPSGEKAEAGASAEKRTEASIPAPSRPRTERNAESPSTPAAKGTGDLKPARVAPDANAATGEPGSTRDAPERKIATQETQKPRTVPDTEIATRETQKPSTAAENRTAAEAPKPRAVPQENAEKSETQTPHAAPDLDAAKAPKQSPRAAAHEPKVASKEEPLPEATRPVSEVEKDPGEIAVPVQRRMKRAEAAAADLPQSAERPNRKKASKSARSRPRANRASLATRTKGWRKRGARRASNRGTCSRNAVTSRKAGQNIHVVRPGDTLWGLARRHLKSGRSYRLIYRANRRRIANPHLIYPCQHLVMPKRKRCR